MQLQFVLGVFFIEEDYELLVGLYRYYDKAYAVADKIAADGGEYVIREIPINE